MKRLHDDDESNIVSAKLDNIIGLFDKILSIDEKTDETDSDKLILTVNSEIITIEPELEWKQLNDNLKKLNYFKTVLSKINKFNKIFFDKAFSKFMEKIDEVNQYYMKVICFDINNYTNSSGFTIYDTDSVKEMVLVISNSLDKSINCNNLEEKMEYVLEAYSNLVLLASDVRETAKDSINNKKVKIN